MPIGDLSRTVLDDAMQLHKAYLAHRESLKDRTLEDVDELSRQRQAKLQERALAYEERNEAIEARKQSEEAAREGEEAVKEQEFAIVFAQNRVSGLRQSLADLQKERRIAVEKHEKAQEKEDRVQKAIEEKLGGAVGNAPKSGDASPELDPEILKWASRFTVLEQRETAEFFQATSERIGTKLDLTRLDREIERCELEITRTKDTIPKLETDLEDLRQSIRNAEAARIRAQESVLEAQKKIDAANEALSNLEYREGLHKLLGEELDAVNLRVIDARAEAETNLEAVATGIGIVRSDALPDEVLKIVDGFRDERGELVNSLAGMGSGGLLTDQLPELDSIFKRAQDIARRFDTYEAGDFLKEALAARMKALETARTEIVAETLDARNKQAPEKFRIKEFAVDDGVLKEIARTCPATDFTVDGQALEPLRVAAAEAYDRAFNSNREAVLKREAEEAELERLRKLEEVAEEEEFGLLNTAEANSIVQAFKSKPVKDAEPELLRDALRDALKLQNCPDYALWCKILGLPYNTDVFYVANRFVDSTGYYYNVHVSFFADCVGSQANRKINLFKKEKTKHTPQEVMQKLFRNNVGPTARAHATIEYYNKDGKKPHVYYYNNKPLHFDTTYEQKIRIYDPCDTQWVAKGIAHSRTQLNNRMALLEARVKNWLDTDGKR